MTGDALQSPLSDAGGAVPETAGDGGWLAKLARNLLELPGVGWLAARAPLRWILAAVRDFLETYHAASNGERAGLRFWGFVFFVFGFWEIGSATSSLWQGRPASWPTLSTTIGHLEDMYPTVAVGVVAVIVFAAFYAVTLRSATAAAGLESVAEPPRPRGLIPLIDSIVVQRAYTPYIFYGLFTCSSAPVLLLAGIAGLPHPTKFQQGYVIYGALGFWGFVVPTILQWRRPSIIRFPSLFATLAVLRTRFRKISMIVIAGLTILVVHLAFYPWPDLSRQPNTYAGYNSSKAREVAEHAIARLKPKTALFFLSETRAEDSARQPIWLVSFERRDFLNSGLSGCVVSVAKQRGKPLTLAANSCSS